ncbi:MAG: HD domain-containing protein [Oscillospiraceae bacterium]|nr:HD domain-containing protein [Candidatus Limimonas egerieequi]
MYEKLSSELENRILMDQNRTLNEPPRRVDNPHDRGSAWRPAYVRDADKILHCPFYNRYADKTQVFSFYKNDDISRRGAHVQFVSRNARTIGRALGLDLDLIEAIALGHDIGHTPFGHAGEKYLDELFYSHAGRHFAHNIHSVRVLDSIFPLNLTLDTLSGIASHDGELELREYRPDETQTFETFDLAIENCYLDKSNILKLVPNTLEGCVVRISDIISYLGKDRQDAEKLARHNEYEDTAIGTFNAAIINNLIVNIIENSYGKDFIAMDDEHFLALSLAKKENYDKIYLTNNLDPIVRPMMEKIYERLLNDVVTNNLESPIFTHHIELVENSYYRKGKSLYRDETEPNQLVVDYIASMTDDYFIDLYTRLFGETPIEFKGYFD